MKIPQMNNGTRDQRTVRSWNLTERFDHNPRLVKKFAFQNEKKFTLEVPVNVQNNRVYFEGKKNQIPEQNLSASIKVMVLACLTWKGETKPLFVNGSGVKENAQTYKRHLQKELLSAVQRLYIRKNWIFEQDNVPSHRSNLVQDFLQEAINSFFIKTYEWLPSSPDCNPLKRIK